MSAEDHLATVDGIRDYVADTPFSCSNVTALTGGYGNYTFRLHLANPYMGQKTLVLKHGKAWLPADKLDRQTYDAEALRRVRTILPADSLVTTPNVYLFDTTSHVIIMEDCGADAVPLKELFLQDGALSVGIAHKIGTALGTFLAQVHTWGRNDEVLDFFEGNREARMISAWATYGRVVSTLTTDNLPALSDPPLDVSAQELEDLAAVADDTAETIRSARETVVHGDFWPGNMMVRLRGEGDAARDVERIYMLDWELVKPSLPGFDVGQFAAEVHQARSFYPHCEAATSTLLQAFLTAYREGSREGDMERTARLALTNVGAHLATWTPRISTWSDRQMVRKVVMEGVQYLLRARKEEDDLRETMFGPLLVSK